MFLCCVQLKAEHVRPWNKALASKLSGPFRSLCYIFSVTWNFNVIPISEPLRPRAVSSLFLSCVKLKAEHFWPWKKVVASKLSGPFRSLRYIFSVTRNFNVIPISEPLRPREVSSLFLSCVKLKAEHVWPWKKVVASKLSGPFRPLRYIFSVTRNFNVIPISEPLRPRAVSSLFLSCVKLKAEHFWPWKKVVASKLSGPFRPLRYIFSVTRNFNVIPMSEPLRPWAVTSLFLSCVKLKAEHFWPWKKVVASKLSGSMIVPGTPTCYTTLTIHLMLLYGHSMDPYSFEEHSGKL